jgi:hypothetical protein
MPSDQHKIVEVNGAGVCHQRVDEVLQPEIDQPARSVAGAGQVDRHRETSQPTDHARPAGRRVRAP